jgi:polyisoprenoid-binding protein YceI
MAGNSKWIIDPGHSEIQFKIKHLAVSHVTGRFRIFQGDLVCGNEDFNDARIHVTLDSGSIDTNNAQRDAHLKSPDFIDAEKYPGIAFDGLLKKDGEDYVLEGEMVIREVRSAVKLRAGLTGVGTGRFGDTRAGFEVKGKISRKDFGLTWNVLADGGGLVIGDEISLLFDIQLIKC